MTKKAPKTRSKVEYDSKELVDTVRGGASNKEIMEKFGFKSATQVKMAYANAAMELDLIPKITDSRTVSTPDKKVAVRKSGSLSIPKEIVDELGFKESDSFTIKKTKTGISLKFQQ